MYIFINKSLHKFRHRVEKARVISPLITALLIKMETKMMLSSTKTSATRLKRNPEHLPTYFALQLKEKARAMLPVH